MGTGQGAGILFSASLFCEFESSLLLGFELFWEFFVLVEFQDSCEIHEFQGCCLGTGLESIVGRRENCVVYNLLVISIIIIIVSIISSSISISFVLLLNYLYLSQGFSLLSISPSYPAGADGEVWDHSILVKVRMSMGVSEQD